MEFDTAVGIVLGIGFMIALGLLWMTYEHAKADKAISQLIRGNKATPRPGMDRRDDALLARAELRARARRSPQ